jgi:hypothetical protein
MEILSKDQSYFAIHTIMTGESFIVGQPILSWAELHKKLRNRSTKIVVAEDYKIYIIYNHRPYKAPGDDYSFYSIFIELNTDDYRFDAIKRIYNTTIHKLEEMCENKKIAFSNVYLIDTAYKTGVDEYETDAFFDILFHSGSGHGTPDGAYCIDFYESIVNENNVTTTQITMDQEFCRKKALEKKEKEGWEEHETIFNLCCQVVYRHFMNVDYMKQYKVY